MQHMVGPVQIGEDVENRVSNLGGASTAYIGKKKDTLGTKDLAWALEAVFTDETMCFICLDLSLWCPQKKYE